MLKKILVSFLSLVLVGLLYLYQEGKDMREISSEIEIAAPPAKVWGLITQFDRWHEWSPIIKASSGRAGLGEKIDITMVGMSEESTGPRYSPTITVFDEPKNLRWRAHMMAPIVFTNDKLFELEETPSGTRLVHKELFSGLLAPIFCGQMEEGVPPMLDAMNMALKELAEKS